MSYAVRNDKQGWRSVSGPDDVGADEWYSVDTPPDPVPLPPSVEDLIVLANEKRDQLLAGAANRMGPLQDAIDEKTSTESELTSLKLWRQYRIDLNRIEQQEGFPAEIQWPSAPESQPLGSPAQ